MRVVAVFTLALALTTGCHPTPRERPARPTPDPTDAAPLEPPRSIRDAAPSPTGATDGSDARRTDPTPDAVSSDGSGGATGRDATDALSLTTDAAPRAGWRLVWHDEFDGAAGTAPDASRWGFEVGGHGWGNRELQFYTDRRENAALDGRGSLALHVLAEVYQNRTYTSARLTTQKKFEFTYGRVEARIKVPAGAGIWSAFWMLGANIGEVSWPACGEIDIMENIGRMPATVIGTLHGPGYSGGGGVTKWYAVPDAVSAADDFHVYAVEWEPEVIRFYYDETLYVTRTPSDLRGKEWVFQRPFYMLLNVAVGGTLGGTVDAASFPASMLVDYVRVYQR